jgi:tRNA threonylcarbamoyl adenosine modification protein YeaZ
MLTLAADSSLPLLSVALMNDASLLGSVVLEGKGSRNEKLLPAIDWLLTENHIDRKAIELFAVTRGPGSFTGVRIGLATIQGLALALGRPVIAMSTHEAIVGGQALLPVRTGESACPPLTIVDDAGRGEFYVSVFEGRREVVAPHLEKELPNDRLIRVEDFLLYGNNVAVGCARRALQIVRDGEQDRYADATPIYVRLAEADVKLQQKRNE